MKERKRRTDCARAAAMAVAGKTACGEVGESAQRKAERRSVDRELVKLNSMRRVVLHKLSRFHCTESDMDALIGGP